MEQDFMRIRYRSLPNEKKGESQGWHVLSHLHYEGNLHD